MQTEPDWIQLDRRLVRSWPLPEFAHDADKEARGRVLVVAGSREIPGAGLLAGTAALRVGAGKLVMATGQSVAAHLALAVPEARVIALPETAQGSFALHGLALLEDVVEGSDAVLVGPGLVDEAGTTEFACGLLPMLGKVPLVLDALAMNVVKGRPSFDQPVLLTPHAGEMAHLLGRGKEAIVQSTEQSALAAARDWNCVVALKGATTLIATPAQSCWRHEAGSPGLGTSGSGDVLAGLAVGMAAQQVPLEQACAWSVVLHALAGARLARKLGPLGFLARELSGEIPALLKQLRRPTSGMAALSR